MRVQFAGNADCTRNSLNICLELLHSVKRETAEKNDLNYVVLWNLEEIERYKDELLKRVIYTRINNLA